LREIVFLEALFRVPPLFLAATLRAGPLRPALFRAGPRLRALERARDADFPLRLFGPAVFLAEVRRRREPAAAFLPPLELPRDDFLAAAMISAPR